MKMILKIAIYSETILVLPETLAAMFAYRVTYDISSTYIISETSNKLLAYFGSSHFVRPRSMDSTNMNIIHAPLIRTSTEFDKYDILHSILPVCPFHCLPAYVSLSTFQEIFLSVCISVHLLFSFHTRSDVSLIYISWRGRNVCMSASAHV